MSLAPTQELTTILGEFYEQTRGAMTRDVAAVVGQLLAAMNHALVFQGHATTHPSSMMRHALSRKAEALKEDIPRLVEHPEGARPFGTPACLERIKRALGSDGIHAGHVRFVVPLPYDLGINELLR